jgi:hypothetical protein
MHIFFYKNCRYYSHEWISEDPNRVYPHQDMELTDERVKCFKRLFPDADERRKVNVEFATFQMEEKVLLTLILWMIGVRWTQNLGG